jgi:hypothetical protein
VDVASIQVPWRGLAVRLAPALLALPVLGVLVACGPGAAGRAPTSPPPVLSAVDPPAAGPSGPPEQQLARRGLSVVGHLRTDVTQDGVPEDIYVAVPADCTSCDVRRVAVFQDDRLMLDVEARTPQVTPLPGRYGLTVREALSEDGPPCCDGDHVTHTFIWQGGRFVADRRAEALRDALTRQVDAFVASLDPALRRAVDGLSPRHPDPRQQDLLDQYQRLLGSATRAEDATLLRAYRRWWHDRLFDGLAGAAQEVLPRQLSDPRAIEDFAAWSLMRA